MLNGLNVLYLRPEQRLLYYAIKGTEFLIRDVIFVYQDRGHLWQGRTS